MGLLTEIRERIGDFLGGSEEADTDEEADEETPKSDPAEPDGDRLDPAAVTDTRSAATDDAVDKLRSVREAAPAEETGPDDEDAPLGASDDPPDEAADTSTDPSAGDGKR